MNEEMRGGIGMADHVLEWLLDGENPSVRYFALLSRMGKPAEDPEVLEARKTIMEKGPVPKILSLQNEEGYWDDPDRFYKNKYNGTAWAVLLLAELGADPDDPRVRKACGFLLDNSQEKEEGGFSIDRSTRLGGGRPGGVIPCLTGNMVYALTRLGFGDDPRVRQAIAWICRYQRADDGETGFPADPFYQRYRMCFGKHTCHMGAAKALKGLAAIPSGRRSPEMSAKIDELAEYFLIHHLYKKSHSLGEDARPGWLRPGFPLMYQTDNLELLEIMKSLGIRDARLKEAEDALGARRLEDGTWRLENSFNGKMPVTIERKGERSRWITMKALNVLT